jgi:hypothetical protein
MPSPPNDRQQLHHELAERLVELAALRQEMESPAPRHARLVGQIENLECRLRALRTRWVALPAEPD